MNQVEMKLDSTILAQDIILKQLENRKNAGRPIARKMNDRRGQQLQCYASELIHRAYGAILRQFQFGKQKWPTQKKVSYFICQVHTLSLNCSAILANFKRSWPSLIRVCSNRNKSFIQIPMWSKLSCFLLISDFETDSIALNLSIEQGIPPRAEISRQTER